MIPSINFTCQCGRPGKMQFTIREIKNKQYPISEKEWMCWKCHKWIQITSEQVKNLLSQLGP